MKNLIFIEGISGAGKSTTVKSLSDKLLQAGYSVEYYLEFDFTNPIDFYCVAYFKQDEYEDLLAQQFEFAEVIENNTIFTGDIRLIRYYKGKIALFPEPLLNFFREREFCWKPCNPVPITEYTRVYRTIWEKFAHDTDRRLDYMLFDGSLFHHPINDLLRNYNASSGRIAEHVNTLLQAVSSLRPAIIYLSTDNVAERLQKARSCRGEPPCSEEQITFWEKRKQADMAVMKKISAPFKLYDISQGNRNDVLLQILNDMVKNN